MTSCCLSIDWGGSELKGIFTGNNREFILSAGNLRLLGEERLLQICRDIVAAADIFDKSANWLIGAAGADDRAAADRLTSAIKVVHPLSEAISVKSDYECNHAACLDGKDGILSINGTGSVIFARFGEKSIKLGGWGYVLDELPSGAWFGRKALEGVLRCIEGSEEHRAYLAVFEQRFGKASRNAIIDELYRAPSIQKKLGEYAPVLSKALAAGCPSALEAVENSVAQLVEVCRQAAEQTGMIGEVTLCGSGGLWEKWPEFAGYVEKEAVRQEFKLRLVRPAKALHFGPLIVHARSL
ncbi:MAG: hypothetical protein KKB51_01065 [Candidatus Riflebacteria bacterium]|nr:hypothetical protein [Candidatus Riflebacteria bacterium]